MAFGVVDACCTGVGVVGGIGACSVGVGVIGGVVGDTVDEQAGKISDIPIISMARIRVIRILHLSSGWIVVPYAECVNGKKGCLRGAFAPRPFKHNIYIPSEYC